MFLHAVKLGALILNFESKGTIIGALEILIVYGVFMILLAQFMH